MLSACNLLKNNINDPKALTSKDMVSLTYRHCPQSVQSARVDTTDEASLACPWAVVACMLFPQTIPSVCGQSEYPAALLTRPPCERFPQAWFQISFLHPVLCLGAEHLRGIYLHMERRANFSHSSPFCMFCCLQNLWSRQQNPRIF